MTARQLIAKLPRRARPAQTKRLRWAKLSPQEWLKVLTLAKERDWRFMAADTKGLTFQHLPRCESS